MSSSITLAKAGDEYHIILAKYYHAKDIAREEVLNLLKNSNYTVALNNQVVKFNAISVMGIMQGLELASSNNRLISGEKTKAKP